jgi:hypothetical protein
VAADLPRRDLEGEPHEIVAHEEALPICESWCVAFIAAHKERPRSSGLRTPVCGSSRFSIAAAVRITPQMQHHCVHVAFEGVLRV